MNNLCNSFPSPSKWKYQKYYQRLPNKITFATQSHNRIFQGKGTEVFGQPAPRLSLTGKKFSPVYEAGHIGNGDQACTADVCVTTLNGRKHR